MGQYMFVMVDGQLINLMQICQVVKLGENIVLIMINGNSVKTNLTEFDEFKLWFASVFDSIMKESITMGMEAGSKMAEDLFDKLDGTSPIKGD